MSSVRKISRNASLMALALSLVSPFGAEAVFAQAAAVQTADIGEDIIVSARRRDESLIDVPLSVTAVSGDTLESLGVPDIASLQQQAPNVTTAVARGSNSTLIAFVRGVGQQDPLWGFEPGVGLYVDDVYVARPQGAVLDIFDVERVEVLRGPQGTLYGRNTIGGAIKYVTRRLGHDFSGRVKASYGSYNEVNLSGTVAIPLGPNLSVGGGVLWAKRDGWGRNLFTGAGQYDKDVLAGRLSLEYDNGDVFVRVAGDRTEDKSNPRHGTRLQGNMDLPDFEPTPSLFDTRAGIGDDNKVVTQGASLTAEVRIADDYTLKSISAYRDGRTDTLIDFDNTPGPVLDVPAFYKDWQFTQEVQLLVEKERLQGVFGLFYLNGRATGAFDTVAGNVNFTIYTGGNVKTESIAAFGDLSYDLTDRLQLSAGLRWTRDDKTGTVLREQYLGIRSPAFGNADAFYLDTRSDYSNSRSFDKFTPRLSLSFQPAEDVNLYASWGRGFKSGGFDMRGDVKSTPNTVDGYRPETIDSYEAGLKGAFLDRTLFLNLAGFYSRYKDQQVTIQAPTATPGVIASFVDNAGKATIYGVEAELRAVPTRNLSWQGSFGYTHAKYDEFLTWVDGGTAPVDVSGERFFQNTPEFTLSSSLTWSLDVAGGRLSFTPAVSLRSAIHMFEYASELDQGGYVLVDGSANWESADGRFSLGVHGRNLTDQRYRVGGYYFPGALYGNSIIGYYGAPRTVMGSIGYRF